MRSLYSKSYFRHRGPDWNGITCFRNCYLAHERLAINGLLSGAQVRLLLLLLL